MTLRGLGRIALGVGRVVPLAIDRSTRIDFDHHLVCLQPPPVPARCHGTQRHRRLVLRAGWHPNRPSSFPVLHADRCCGNGRLGQNLSGLAGLAQHNVKFGVVNSEGTADDPLDADLERGQLLEGHRLVRVDQLKKVVGRAGWLALLLQRSLPYVYVRLNRVHADQHQSNVPRDVPVALATGVQHIVIRTELLSRRPLPIGGLDQEVWSPVRHVVVDRLGHRIAAVGLRPAGGLGTVPGRAVCPVLHPAIDRVDDPRVVTRPDCIDPF